MSVKNCCVFTEYSGRSTRIRVAKRKAFIVGREGPRVSCGNKALGRQIFIVGLLQLVERQHFHAELGRELQQWEGNSKGGCL